MNKLRIGGVPEHFNLPWHLLLETNASPLAEAGLGLDWHDFPEGTGAMVRALADGRLDAAVLLTEGAAAALEAGARFEVLSLYTETPLIWGMHVPAASAFGDVEALAGARFAISRHGSGSHLMAFALADAYGWPADRLRFVVVGTLAGAIESFRGRESDVFLWEKFMTQPVVDSGDFRRVGEFSAAWPAFVVVVSGSVPAAARDGVRRALEGALAAAAKLAAWPDAAERIAARYGLEASNAADWLAVTRWARAPTRADAAVAAARAALARAGAL